MNNMYDILAKLNSVGKQNLTEGWKGELAGGTAGGIAGTIAGNAISPGIGGMVGGALGATAGGMAGRAAGEALDETSQLNEIAPLIAAGARIAGPMIGKIAQALGRGASTAGKATADAAGKAAAGVGRGVADVSKEVGKAAVANAPAVGVGVGAYEIAKQMADKMPDAVNQVYSDVGQTAKAVTSVVGDALGSATVMDVAGAAVKYAIPAGLLLAVLYGGKKLIDKVMSEDAMMEENDMRSMINKLDYVAEGWKGTAAGAGLGALAGGPLGAAVGALAGDKIGDEMEEGKRPDFPDLDKDGDKKEPMAQAARQAKGKEQVDEISLDKIGRGIGKAIGVPARVAGAVAGIPGGLKQAYQSSKAGAQKAISGQDMDCYPKGAKVAVGEADVEEGNDFTGARMAAIKAGKPTFRVDGKVYKVTGDTSDERVMEKKEKTLFPGTAEYEKRFPKELRPGERAKSSTGGTIEKTATGVKHTARYDDDTDADDGSKAAQADKYASPKAKGRPKGSKRAIGAKVKGTSKLHSKPAIKEASTETVVTNKGNRYNYVLGDDEMTSQIMFNGTEIHLQYDPNMQAFDPQESRAKDPILNKWLKQQQPFESDEDSIDDFVDRAVDHLHSKPAIKETDSEIEIPGSDRMSDDDRHRAIMKKYPGAKKTGKTPGEYTLPDGTKLVSGIRGVRKIDEDYDKDEYDEEGEMAQSQARTIEDAAKELQSILDADENLPEWVQKKISLAMDYIDTARDYLAANRPQEQGMEESALQAYLGKEKYGEAGMKALQQAGREGASKEKMASIRAKHDKLDEVDLDEKAVSKAQRAAAGIARAVQKGEIPRSELRGASKEMAKMPAGELKKFAKTKEKGLPEKVKKDESVEETTVAGSVAPSVEAPKGKKGGMIFGKGVYEGRLEESYKSRLETMLTEGMSINMSVGEDGRKNLSVSATDDDAVKLAQILKLAGMEQATGYDDACPTCGAGRGMCEHEMVEEADLANSADDTVYADTDYMTQTLAGGLNGPKLQVNPNNPADNPLSMRTLGQHSSSSLNLGSEADNLKEETERRLMDLYQRFEVK